MRKKVLLALAATAICAVMALPVAAQTIALKANVPFAYNVGTATIPAGEYAITKDVTGQFILLRATDGPAVAGSLVMKSGVVAADPAGDMRLVFNRYGGTYFLAEVVDANAGTAYVLPQTHAERELAKTASVQRENVNVMLARR